MPRSIRVATFGDLRAQGYRLRVDCPACRHFLEVDLAQLGRDEESFVGRRWRCSKCGARGGATMWPPTSPQPGAGRP